LCGLSVRDWYLANCNLVHAMGVIWSPERDKRFPPCVAVRAQGSSWRRMPVTKLPNQPFKPSRCLPPPPTPGQVAVAAFQ